MGKKVGRSNVKTGKLCRKRINIACYGVILGYYLYMYAMLYAKMFYGHDKMKHFETSAGISITMAGLLVIPNSPNFEPIFVHETWFLWFRGRFDAACSSTKCGFYGFVDDYGSLIRR